MDSLTFKAHYEQNLDHSTVAWLEDMFTSQNLFNNSDAVCMASNVDPHWSLSALMCHDGNLISFTWIP